MRHADSLPRILILQCLNHLSGLDSRTVAVFLFGLTGDLLRCKPLVQSTTDGTRKAEMPGRMACAATGMHGTLFIHAKTCIPVFERILIEPSVVSRISPQVAGERVSPLFAADNLRADGTGETMVWFHVAFAFIHDDP